VNGFVKWVAMGAATGFERVGLGEGGVKAGRQAARRGSLEGPVESCPTKGRR